MFAQKQRCRYRCHQLAEVVCQLRFPEILAIPANPPVEFQEAIRSEYPQLLPPEPRPGSKAPSSTTSLYRRTASGG